MYTPLVSTTPKPSCCFYPPVIVTLAPLQTPPPTTSAATTPTASDKLRSPPSRVRYSRTRGSTLARRRRAGHNLSSTAAAPPIAAAPPTAVSFSSSSSSSDPLYFYARPASSPSPVPLVPPPPQAMGTAAAATVEEDGQTQTRPAPEFKLVGHANFVRSNPRTDRFPVRAFHHVEFWCSDATNVSRRFSHGLGMPLAAHSDLSTGNSAHASYLLRSGSLQFLFTAPYPSSVAGASAAAAAIPSFDAARCHRFAETHGLGVRAVAVLVDDAAEAFAASVANGARPVFQPMQLPGGAAIAEVELYGDVVLRYVSLPGDHHHGAGYSFLPGFEDDADHPEDDLGLRRLDHAVGNVPDLGPAVDYIRRFTGFHEFAEFTAEDVGTAESGLNSLVLANNDETVLLPLNEPVQGKRRSQIQTYLDHNLGPGLQHLALATDDAISTVRGMRRRSRAGGFEFMPSPPPTYYQSLRKRAADVLSEEQMAACEELGILVDRDDQGTLLQIFTKPVGDRPTIFLEIIQRIGCMAQDQQGNIYQKGGCGGFGKGNFSELFKSIEEYEKALEAKQLQQQS